MAKLNIVFNADNSPRLPVYAHYPNQYRAQPAFIWLDLANGNCGADYSGEIGGAIPESVWHGRVLRFTISATLMAWGIAELLAEIKEDLQTILDGSEIEWDGNNWTGTQNTAAASAAIEKVEHACDSYYSENIIIDAEYLEEWSDDDLYPAAGESVEAFNDALGILDGEDGCYFDDNMIDPAKRLARLEEIWADRLYDGDYLPKVAAQHLLQQGICDDSAWLDELKAFAK